MAQSQMLKSEFDRYSMTVANILRDPQGYMDGLASTHPDAFMQAFNAASGHIRCVDERLKNSEANAPIAGSGYGLDDEEVVYIGEVAERSGFTLTGVKGHYSCGKVAQELAKRKSTQDPNQASVDNAKRVASLLKAPYLGELSVAPDYHNARMAVVTGSRTCQTALLPAFPPAFNVVTRYLKHDRRVAEVGQLAVDIALGDHGFGPLFTRQNPFGILILGVDGEPDNGVEQITARLKGVNVGNLPVTIGTALLRL